MKPELTVDQTWGHLRSVTVKCGGELTLQIKNESLIKTKEIFMRNGNIKPLIDFNFKNFPQLEVKMMEPRRNNSTATSVKRSQTLILAGDRDDGALLQTTLTAVSKDSLGNGHEGINNHEVGAVTNNQGVKTKLQNPTMMELNKQPSKAQVFTQ